MKKLLSTLLCTTILWGLSACGNPAVVDSPTPTNTAPTDRSCIFRTNIIKKKQYSTEKFLCAHGHKN